jgi:hypothetical protein
MVNVSPHTRRLIENAAYNRAADLAQSHAEHWERETRAGHDDHKPGFSAELKAAHWRIIEKAIRGLAVADPKSAKSGTGRG